VQSRLQEMSDIERHAADRKTEPIELACRPTGGRDHALECIVRLVLLVKSRVAGSTRRGCHGRHAAPVPLRGAIPSSSIARVTARTRWRAAPSDATHCGGPAEREWALDGDEGRQRPMAAVSKSQVADANTKAGDVVHGQLPWTNSNRA